jgi:hypothetical protein
MPEDKDLSMETFISADREIDVEQIMNAIQKRIREKKDAGVLKQSEIDEIVDMELLPLPDFLEVPNVYEPHLYPGTDAEDLAKKVFHPREIKLEVEEGPGFRGFIKKILIKIRRIVFPLVRFMIRPIYNELKQFCNDNYNDNAHKIFEIESYKPVVMHSKEYIRLMHNALNNMIVETSKLKIDHELQKTKIKILENKIEFLENRERAIEKKIFPREAEPKNVK